MPYDDENQNFGRRVQAMFAFATISEETKADLRASIMEACTLWFAGDEEAAIERCRGAMRLALKRTREEQAAIISKATGE